jgi:hypothetical protein
MVAAAPFGKRRIAFEKLAAHVTGMTAVAVAIGAVTWIGTHAAGKLPGDALPLSAGDAAAIAVIATELIDFLAPPLNLPDWFHRLALTANMGLPMVGQWNWAGVGACLAIAAGGLLIGAWGMRRRDVAR